MAALTQQRKEAMAETLRVISTWVAGPRRVKVLELREELLGTDPDQVETKVQQVLAAEDAPTERPSEAAALEEDRSTDES